MTDDWLVPRGAMSYSCAMMKMTIALRTLIPALLLAATASAQSVWVSDQFEITLRSGPSTNNAIQLMLRSGTELEVLDEDEESGYTQVRTQGGTEGWVLTRYLMNEPAARDQLSSLTSQLSNQTSRGSSLNSQLSTIRGEYEQAQERIATLERDKSALETELADIKRTASNVLTIDAQNKDLRDQLAAAEIEVATLEQENRELSSQTTRYWFMTGALVLVIGMALGLWLPTDSLAATVALRSGSDRIRTSDLLAGKEHPGFHDGIGVQRHTFDTLIQQPAREIRMVRRSLAADADVLVAASCRQRWSLPASP